MQFLVCLARNLFFGRTEAAQWYFSPRNVTEEEHLIPKHMPCSKELSSASSKAFKSPGVNASEIHLKINFHAQQTVC